MKLESFKDKKVTRRKMVLISLGVITIIGVSLLLYKTFASFSEEVSFPMMSGKVNYYGNADVLFGFYNGETKLDEMPQKGNPDKLEFEKAVCDNGASVEWDEEKWAPLVKNLTKTKTRCTLYFTKAVPKAQFPGKAIPLAEEGKDGLYAVEHNNLSELDSSWNKTEYRYAGVDPDNYVLFNNEKWRIIGLVNVKTATGVEQRIKIIRTDGIEGQIYFGNYSWDRASGSKKNWTTSKLKDMLNGIYYNSGSGECYIGSITSTSQSECDFSTGESIPKGLDDTARQMIDSEVIWNIGGWNTSEITADTMYEKERGNTTSSSFPAEWTKENDETYHKGIGLMYPSDYGYAVGGELRNTCLSNNLIAYGTYNCYKNDWLRASSGEQWLLSPSTYAANTAFYVDSNGGVFGASFGVSLSSGAKVWPVGYLSPSTTISDGDGTFDNPFLLKNGS